MALKNIFINMGLLGLLIFGIMAFVIIAQDDNDVSIPITNDSRIDTTYSGLQTQLDNSKTESEAADEAFNPNDIPTAPQGELGITAIFKAADTAKSIVFGLWNVLALPLGILGVSNTVISIIGSILLVVIIIGAWAIWKGVVS